MKWVGGVLLLIAALLVWDGRTVAMIRFAGNVHEPPLDSDFKQLGEVLPKSGAVLTEMYVGLSHPYFDKEEFVHELWSQPNRSIKGYRFQSQPATTSEVVKSAFVEVLSAGDSFRAYQGPKLCGGYHADFAVKLESGGVATWFLVCLGCGEVLIYSKDKELICELEPVAETRLREAWSDHLGEPFKLVQTRLPVSRDELEELGYTEYRRTHSDRPPGKACRAVLPMPPRRAPRLPPGLRCRPAGRRRFASSRRSGPPSPRRGLPAGCRARGRGDSRCRRVPAPRTMPAWRSRGGAVARPSRG